MSNFETNTQKAFELFESVLPTYEAKKEFLSNLDNSVSSFEQLDPENKEKITVAVRLLVENAMVTETRKMQQANFGPALAMLRQSPENIVKEIKSNSEFFTHLIQLAVIFLHFKDIENEKHNHDHIRVALRQTLEKVIPLL